jgi:uncharacterized DUF497 family protein
MSSRSASFAALQCPLDEAFVSKIEQKHGVSTDEVEEVLFSRPHVRRAETGKVKGEHLYVAYGRTTEGRFLVVFSSASLDPLRCRFLPVK